MTYRITDFAINVITDIALYTVENWGVDAVQDYVTGLKSKLDAIGRGEVVKEECFDLFSDLYVTRYRHYLIYYVFEVDQIPRIVRLIHHKRDVINQLEKALAKLYRAKEHNSNDLK